MKYPIIPMLFCVAALVHNSACVPLAVGGAGAGGYYVGKDDRPVGTMAEDAAITTKVNAAFVGDKLVSAATIDVDTYEGVVTLTGTVDNARAAERAIALTRKVEGVRRVISRLKVK